MGTTLLDKIAWVIIPMPNRPDRYLIQNTYTGKILDDAQGSGFSSEELAFNYGKNKYHTNGMCDLKKVEVNQLF